MFDDPTNRRRMLGSVFQGAAAVFLGAGFLPVRALGSSDPRPEFSSGQIEDVLDLYFGTRQASDDASIRIEAPLEVQHGELVPFRITVPGAEKIALCTDANDQPLIMAMERIHDRLAVMLGHARLGNGGRLICYALREGQLGRAERPLKIVGSWRELSQ